MTEFGDNITLSAISWDLALLVFVATVLFVLGLSGGRRAIIPFLVALYIARTVAELSENFPQIQLPVFAEAAVFLGTAAVITWLLSGSALTEFLRFSTKGLSVWWQILVAAVLGAGLFGTLFFPLIPKDAAVFSVLIDRFILRNPFPFLWAFAPVAFLFFLRAESDNN